MECVEGKSLDQLLHHRPLPLDQVVALGLQIAQALSRAHRRRALDLGMADVEMLYDRNLDPLRNDRGFQRLAAETKRRLASK